MIFFGINIVVRIKIRNSFAGEDRLNKDRNNFVIRK